MNAQECTQASQEARIAREKHRVEVLVPRQIQALSEEIEQDSREGGERIFAGSSLHPETKAHFEGLGFYVEPSHNAISWGSLATRQRLRDQEAMPRRTIWQRIFGVGP